MLFFFSYLTLGYLFHSRDGPARATFSLLRSRLVHFLVILGAEDRAGVFIWVWLCRLHVVRSSREQEQEHLRVLKAKKNCRIRELNG